MRSLKMVAALALLLPALVAPTKAVQSAGLEIRVLSNRPGLLSGGDALVEIHVAGGAERMRELRVALDGRDVTSSFAVRANGRYMGLVTGLRRGANTLTVSRAGTPALRLMLSNHDVGGPIFSGEQLMPWACSTAENPSLGDPVDAQCNAPTQFRFVYRTRDGRFQPYDAAVPPADLATVIGPDGHVAPFIVRVERGTMNRGIHEIAVLAEPGQPWPRWDGQTSWRGKLLLKYGGGTGQMYRQGHPVSVLDPDALARGYVVASSSMLVNGQHANFVTAAETSLMLKEHVIEHYGELQYTVGEGGSGGALLQYLIADAYPGILDGLRPTQDWQDSLSGAYREFADSGVIMQAIASSPLTYSDGERAAIGGWGGTNVNIFNTESQRVVDYIRPDDGTKCAGADSYDPMTNPRGVRCTFQDFMASVIGRRLDGAAHLVYDNVGVQYGLKAVEAGLISVDQFVDLNVRAGGYDRDGRWQPTRNRINEDVAARLYRSGHVTQGRGLASVAILAIRGTNNNDYHYPYRTVVNRARLLAANGHANNHVYWIAPPREVNTLEAMDRWLSAVASDGSADDRPTKVVRNRPSDLTSGCWIEGERTADVERCDRAFPHASEPRTVAGDTPTISTLSCQLKPLARGEYPVRFTEAQWEALERAFPSGVCDFTSPGVGLGPTTTWLSY